MKSRLTMMASDDNTLDIAEAGKHEVDEFVKAQTAALQRFQAAHRRWFDLWQAEAILLVDFGHKLAHARSIPEVRKIYRDTTVQLKIATKDAKRIIDDNEAAARDVVELFTNGWTPHQQARRRPCRSNLIPCHCSMRFGIDIRNGTGLLCSSTRPEHSLPNASAEDRV
jgi:hypothetical protein